MEDSVVEVSIVEDWVVESSVVEGSVAKVVEGSVAKVVEGFAAEAVEAIDSSMEGTNAGAVSIEDATTVEISLSIEGFGADVLDGAIGSVMGECFLGKAAVGSSMQWAVPSVFNLFVD